MWRGNLLPLGCEAAAFLAKTGVPLRDTGGASSLATPYRRALRLVLSTLFMFNLNAHSS
ncbi:hypothetical protein EMIT0P171_150062 [Pseudomonas sp. IT-P171]